MVDYISNIGIESQSGVGQIHSETFLQEDGLVQGSVEMESSYSSTLKSIDYQLLKLEVNGQRYNGIPDIFQTNDPKLKPLFDTLRAEGVISDDMSLEDQQRIMSYVSEIAVNVQQIENSNQATASGRPVTSYINPQDSSVVALASRLQAQGIITEGMTDAEKMAAITNYVNSNIRQEADQPGEGWNRASDTIASGSGDCEDLAILAANLAIACGVAESKVQVCVKGGSATNQGHVVVGLIGENGKIATYDATNLEQETADMSDFTFTFNSKGVASGNGSVGNRWVMEDANNVNSMYTSTITETANLLGDKINQKYQEMLDLAKNLDSYTAPGALFKLQQDLQTMKDMIATYTAMGKMIGDTLSEAMKSFAQSLNR